MSFLAKPARAPKPTPTGGRVVLVHCSAGSARQWRSLCEALDGYDTVAVDLIGHGTGERWSGAGPLTLSAEAKVITEAAGGDQPVHLVGHSYGGGVALAWAVANPGRLRSLTLIEPSAFHVLRQAGSNNARLLDEVIGVAEAIVRGVITGDYRSGMERFIDYWCGAGSWQSMSEARKGQMVQLCGYVAHHFWSLVEEPRTLGDYAVIDAPTLLLSGTASPRPSRAIVQMLLATLPDARWRTVEGATHMSPISHAGEVNAMILEHICETGGQPPKAVHAHPAHSDATAA